MNKEFIPYEQALELKMLDFNEECLATYIKHPNKDVRFDIQEQSGICWHTVKNTDFETGEHCAIPLYQQVFKWFREKHGVKVISVGGDDVKKFNYLLHLKDNSQLLGEKYDTPEEAELACLKKLIEIFKNKK